jgi:hypothetical protein
MHPTCLNKAYTAMTNNSDDFVSSTSDVARAYGVSEAQAERLVSRFSRSWSELDMLLTANGRTRKHRGSEVETPSAKAPYGID